MWCVFAGDFLYPTDPDFNGTRQLPGPYSCTLSEITDQSKPMNRITFQNSDQLNISSVDTTIANTADVDSLLQNGIVTCNI